LIKYEEKERTKMKKVILAIVLAVMLIAGGLGGTVMADTPPDDSPKGMWTIIAEGIEDILEELGFIENDLDDMGGALGRIEGNMVQMETDSGNITVSANTSRFDMTVVAGNYTEIRHVVVTLYVYPGTLDHGGDRIYVSAYWPGSAQGWNVATFGPGSDYKATTFDFNADYWIIDVESDPDTGYTVRYAVTTTYVPES
jgi:hypothetical protein